MRSSIFNPFSTFRRAGLLLGSGYLWVLIAGLFSFSLGVLATEDSTIAVSNSPSNPVVNVAKSSIDKAEVITQKLQLLRPIENESSRNSLLFTSDASTLTIFEYQDQQSLVLADTEWAHLEKNTLNQREQFVLKFFKKKLIKPSSSDGNISLNGEFDAELEMLSAYFAKHDEAFQVVERLNKTPLKLKYAPHTFRTDVRGNRLQVTGATVLFDPHAYALVESNQYSGEEHSRMSPADALLHELLHAEMALRQSKDFIASGAMGGIGYPVEHEREIIARERLLFKAMTTQDGVKRPSRHNHAGAIAVSSCSLCLK